MTRNYFIIFTVQFVFAISFAQPVVNALDFSSSYSSSLYGNSSLNGNAFGNGGPDQVWDYSTFSIADLFGTESIVPVNVAPLAENFPLANYCKMTTLILSSTSTPYQTNYQFYKISAMTIEYLGYSVFYGSSPFPASRVYNNPETVFTFPFTFNTIITDQFQSGTLDTTLYTSQTIYDAYGTLITPYGTYSNVIRTKYERYPMDYQYTNYRYFTTNPIKMIASGTFQTGSNQSAFLFYDNVPLDVMDIKKKLVFGFYPNPANNVLNLVVSEAIKIDKILIMDVSGKIVKTQNMNLDAIEISNLASGLYLIQAYYGDNVTTQKFIKE